MKAKCIKEDPFGDFQVGNVYELTEKSDYYMIDIDGTFMTGVLKKHFDKYFKIVEND